MNNQITQTHLNDTHITALNKFMINNSIKNNTKTRYISQYRQYWKYCQQFNYDPYYMYPSTQYWCHYLLWRVTNNSISVLKSSRRGITYIFVDVLLHKSPFNGPYYKLFIHKMNRIFGKQENKRLPILLHHHIKFCIKYNFNRKNALTCDIITLLTILITQIYGFAGRRCGEILNDTKPLTLQQIQFEKNIQYGSTQINQKCAIINHKDWKTKKNPTDKLSSILGYTNHHYIDPGFYLQVYLLRRQQMRQTLNLTSPVFLKPDNTIYTSKEFKEKSINIFKTKVVDQEMAKNITPYSLRIGLNVMLEARSLSQGQIQSYVGWSRGENSSQIHYTRMPRYWKCGIIKFILETEPNITGWKRWENDLKTKLNKKKRKRFI